MTDNAIEKAAPLFNGGLPLHKNTPQVVPLASQCPAVNEIPKPEHLLTASPDETSHPLPVSNSNAHSQELAHRFFEIDNDQLVIKEADFKGTAKKLQLTRFLVMYIWGYDRLFKIPTPVKDHLLEATKRASLHDGNFAAYLRETTKKYFITLESGLKLNTAGSAFVQKIIAEMDDDKIEGFAYWEGNKPTNRRSGTRHKIDDPKIQEWIDKPSQSSDFDIRTLKTTAECAVFAIWSITKDVKAEAAVSPSEAYV